MTQKTWFVTITLKNNGIWTFVLWHKMYLLRRDYFISKKWLKFWIAFSLVISHFSYQNRGNSLLEIKQSTCSTITFEQVFRFLFLFFYCRKGFHFLGGSVVNIVAIRHFKICLCAVWILVWAISHVNIYPMSQNLDMIFV